jgi:hypothetical protein
MDTEVETEETEPPPRTLWDRLHYALGPLAGGIIIDVADVISAGPVGPLGGMLIGMPVGWYVASMYGFQTPSRLLIATLSGVYCLIPRTELIPLATMISACSRFFAEDAPAPVARSMNDAGSQQAKSPVNEPTKPLPHDSKTP